MASIKKRKSSWFAQVRRMGVSVSRSFPTKSDAQAWAMATETEILAGKLKQSSGKRLIDALDRYGLEVSTNKKGSRNELIRLKAWRELPFAYYRLSDITTPDIAEWRDMRLKEVKSGTVIRDLILLSSVFDIARREWQWVDKNPVSDVRRPRQSNHRQRIFTDEEVGKIVSQLGATGDIVIKRHIIAMAFLFALETAMRREEIISMEWHRVDVNRRVVTIPDSKNDESRQVPLSKRAIEILESLKKFNKPFPVDKNVLTTQFQRACKRAGITDARFHDARATALTRLASRLNVLELARMVGHRDIKSLQIYYRETAESLAAKLD